ncbi:MAG: hypothetical protein JJT96_10515 [Opitutales bacterium]|nr:hypothetical protein [Opitutales bacterium]
MSILLEPTGKHPVLLARLHLFAVLPAFGDLLKHAEPAREILGERRFSLRLRAGSLSSDLYFGRGQFRFLPAFHPGSQLALHFLSYSQLNKQFTGRGVSMPIPVRGARFLGHLRTFSKLSSMLQAGLLSESGLLAYGLEERRASEVHLRLIFSVALGAFTVLVEHESFARALFADGDDWMVQLSVDGAEMDAWISRTGGHCRWGRGTAPGPVLAKLVFDNQSTALKALSGELDGFAAINAGRIRISGLAPLVDKLSLVFERVGAYLDRP